MHVREKKVVFENLFLMFCFSFFIQNSINWLYICMEDTLVLLAANNIHNIQTNNFDLMHSLKADCWPTLFY